MTSNFKDVEGLADFDGFYGDEEEDLLNRTQSAGKLVKRRKKVIKRSDLKHAKEPKNSYAVSRKEDYEWGQLMSFGNQNYLTKIRKHETKIWIGFEIAGLLVALAALVYCYFFFDHFHFNLCKIFGHMGHADAQHKVGERLFYGKGVEKDEVNIILLTTPHLRI